MLPSSWTETARGKTRGEERTFGHKKCITAVRNVINACNEIHIPYLTLYTFHQKTGIVQKKRLIH
jgi:undecaprenyl diphosphate synthase